MIEKHRYSDMVEEKPPPVLALRISASMLRELDERAASRGAITRAEVVRQLIAAGLEREAALPRRWEG